MNLKRLTLTLGLSALSVVIVSSTLLGTAPHPIAQARPNGTIVSGVITQSVTWTTGGSPYTIDGSLTVPNGLTLTVEPGVVVYLVNNGYNPGRLTINGALNAIGTPAHNILFTSGADSAPTQWDALVVSGGTAQLAYAEVRYGGAGYGCSHSYFSPMCVQITGTLSLDHMYFHHNSPVDNAIFGGVVTAFSANDAEQIDLSITHSLFEENGTSNTATGYYPVFLDGPGIRLVMSENTFANNQVNRVLLQNNPLKTQPSAVLTQQAGLEAYEFNSFHTVTSGYTLTLSPGVKLLFRPGPWGAGYALFVEGTLNASGTITEPIVMDATDPAYGWGGLIVQGAGASATLTHTEVLHGGHAGGSNQRYCNVAAVNGGQLFISHSLIADNIVGSSDSSNGVIYLSDGSATLTDNTISNTVASGVAFYSIYVAGPNSTLKMHNNTFSGNSINAVMLGINGLAGTRNTLRPQPGLLGYDFGVTEASGIYTLAPTGTLSLEPGTIMRGRPGPWGRGSVFKVQGQLNATGTPTEPVIFQAMDDSAPATWGGIYVNGGEANLVVTTIRNAGRGQEYPYAGPNPSLWVDGGGRLTVNTALISNNKNLNEADTTVKVENASASIRNSIFTGNGNPGESDYPISISGAASEVTLAGNQFEVNGYKRVLLLDNALTGTDFSLPRVDGLEGYELATKFTVPAGITLTVQPGVTIFGRSNAGLLVNGGLVAQATPGKAIVFTSAANNAPSQWPGVIFSSASAHGTLDGVSLLYGGGSMPPYSDPLGSLIFSNLTPNAVHVLRSKISSSGTAGWQIFNSNVTQDGILDGNRLISNSGYGLRISGASQVLLANTAAVNNIGDGIFLAQSGVQARLLHTTLAGNTSGVRTVNGSTAALTNTILSKNAVGVWAETGSTVTLNRTLWDANITATTGSGAVVNTIPSSGSAAFDPADGYHLTLYSQALGKGQNAGVSTDVDGGSRPQPIGSSPDLGADEFNQSAATEMTAQKLAIPPVWINMPDPGGNPLGELVQKYWIRFLYGSNAATDPAVSVSVEDTLPAGLDFESESHSPTMSFTHTGQLLQWATAQTVSPQQTLDIQIDTRDSAPVAGSTYTNSATLNAGGTNFNLSATTQVPVFTPLITWPESGELCALLDHSFSVEGSAQPGITIEIYEGATLKGQSVTDAQGLFKVSYTASQAGQVALNLRARACVGGTCSDFAQVNLTPPQSFWDPQRSWWEGDPIEGPMAGQHVSFKFRNQDGLASSRHFIIPGVYGFWDTTLHLYVCEDPVYGMLPTQMWIRAAGQVYVPISFSGNMYTYKIGKTHDILIQPTYQPDPPADPRDPDDPPPPPPPGQPPDPWPLDGGPVEIDPDGYVFNSTLGFDPQNPTQHVISGTQVTCMTFLPGWGGWVPWPAHLYHNQINPQVVGSNGYFAFFVPPGQYYLQVEPPAGFQVWRSPVVEVVNEIVHVNVPLTPILAGSTYTLQTSLSGFSQSNLLVPPGSVVKWLAVQGAQEEMSDLVSAQTDPVLHLVSSPDPFSSLTGWDSGRLIPGESYQYRLDSTGTYTYTDSVGHTAIIRVGVENKVYLPLVRR